MRHQRKSKEMLELEVMQLRQQLQVLQDKLQASQRVGVPPTVASESQTEQVSQGQDSEGSDRWFIEEMREGVAALTAEGIILYGNSSLAKLVKRSLEALIGSEFQNWVNAFDRATFRTLLQHAEVAGGHAEVWLVASDGTEIPAYLSLTSFQVNGTLIYCLTATDLRQQRAYNLLHQILESVTDSLAIVDLNFRIIACNKAYQEECERRFGKSVEAGMSLVDAFTDWPLQREKIVQCWSQAFQSESSFIEEWCEPNQELKYYEIRYSPIKDNNHQTIAAIHIGREISDRIRVQKALETALEDLEQKVQQRTQQLQEANQRLERELFESECIQNLLQNQAQLLDLAHDAILTRNLDGAIAFWNRGAQEMYGFSKEEAFGKVSHQLLKTQFPQPLPEIEQYVFQSETWEGALVQIKKDGTQIIVASRWSVRRDPLGNPLEVLEISRDITQARQAKQKLIESEERFRKVFEEAPIGMAVLSSDCRIIKANPMLHKLVELPPEKLTGIPFGELTYPDDFALDWQAIVQAFKAGKSSYKIEKKILGSNRQVLWVMLQISLISSLEENDSGYLVMVEDITERKQIEEDLQRSATLYRQLFEVNPAIALVVNPTNGTIVDANLAACNFYGYKRDVLQKLRLTDLDTLSAEEVFSKMKDILKAGSGYFQLTHKLANGEIRDVEVYASKFILYRQTLIYALIHDISQRKRAEIRLRESEAILRSFYNSAPMMMGIVKIVGERIFHLSHNAATAKFFKTVSTALSNHWVCDLSLPSQVRQVWLRYYRHCEETGGPVNFEYLHPIETGDCWLSVTVSPVIGTPGENTLFSYIAEDITDRKLAAENLVESERRFRAIFEQTFQFTAILRPDGNVVEANDSLLNFSGQSTMDIADRPFWETLWWSSSPEIQNQLQSAIAQAATGNFVRYEVNLPKNAESNNTIDFSIKPLKDECGQVILLIAEGRDITEIKQTQQALEQANHRLKHWVQELEIRNHEIMSLGHLSDILQACFTHEEALQAIARLVQPLFPNISGAVFLFNSSKNLLEATATWGDVSSTQLVFASNDCWGLRRGKAHLAGEASLGLPCHHINHINEPRVVSPVPIPSEDDRPSPSSTSPTFSLCVPMMAQGEALGILYLASQDPDQLSSAKQHLAGMAAEHIALALANIRLHEVLRQQSIRDALTGLFNRRYMEESLQREINRAERQREMLAILMLDVDRFKRFNDTYGHEAGDTVLRELGSFLSQQVRASDIACRYGGEEFLLILPEISLEVAQQRAEQIREGVKRLRLQHRKRDLEMISISVGIAIFPNDGMTGEAVIRAADMALYQAKQQGRDRVIVFNPINSTSEAR